MSGPLNRGREREDLEGVRNRFLICTMRTLSRGPVRIFARGEFASGSKWGMSTARPRGEGGERFRARMNMLGG